MEKSQVFYCLTTYWLQCHELCATRTAAVWLTTMTGSSSRIMALLDLSETARSSCLTLRLFLRSFFPCDKDRYFVDIELLKRHKPMSSFLVVCQFALFVLLDDE